MKISVNNAIKALPNEFGRVDIVREILRNPHVVNLGSQVLGNLFVNEVVVECLVLVGVNWDLVDDSVN